ncbi:MAG TPA: RNA polymerase sigma factor [Candidatus Salinicoccus stercoripullorum]|uniref:RNA polymerase sigma factor SigS n=1 Tax=Candidatus Salinicoccus stercoripullorum TaxID=2838756 RepID=A0A9D1QHV9_9STAP|nr:RNA polymerase sigma factor [Candidatus Salinicoccus stercoripullorum]
MVSSGNTFRCIDTSQEIVMTGFEENEETEHMDADDRAFDLRIREYEPMIQSIIGRLNVRFDQDDYMQVGRLAVYNALSTFDDIAARGATESQFVYTRIYQRMIDEIRRVSRYTNNVSATDDDVLMENTGAAGGEAVLLAELRGMLGTLDRRERQWLLLTLDGYTVVEIAAASGFSVSSVKNWRRSARAKLGALRG